jgi:4-amino-4-deoxy-L-arabinose transferase-like glycosyltransferase
VLAGLVAIVVRVAYVVFVKRHDALVGDEPYFHLTANWLAEGFGFTAQPHTGIPSALHPPLYSLVLTPVSWIASGSALLAQRLTGVVIGIATVVTIGYAGRAACRDRVGVVAAWLAALSPTLWVNDGIVMSESLATLLVAFGLLVVYRYARRPSIAGAAGLGLVCGLAALTRGELLLLVPFLGIPAVLAPREVDWTSRLGRFACVAGVSLVVIAPWALYNVSRFEQPVYVSSNVGGTLCGANNRLTYSGSELGLWERSACPVPHTRPADQSVLNDFWTTRSIDYARDHASRLPVVAAARLARIVGVYAPGQMVTFEAETGARPRFASWMAYVVSLVLVPFAVYGFVVMRRRAWYAAPLVGLVGMVLLVALLLHGDVRYRVPFDVALVILAAAGLEGFTARRRERRVAAAG